MQLVVAAFVPITIGNIKLGRIGELSQWIFPTLTFVIHTHTNWYANLVTNDSIHTNWGTLLILIPPSDFLKPYLSYPIETFAICTMWSDSHPATIGACVDCACQFECFSQIFLVGCRVWISACGNFHNSYLVVIFSPPSSGNFYWSYPVVRRDSSYSDQVVTHLQKYLHLACFAFPCPRVPHQQNFC